MIVSWFPHGTSATPDTGKRHITLYDGGHAVREWDSVDKHFGPSNSGAYSFTDAKTGKPVLIRGTFTIETLP